MLALALAAVVEVLALGGGRPGLPVPGVEEVAELRPDVGAYGGGARGTGLGGRGAIGEGVGDPLGFVPVAGDPAGLVLRGQAEPVADQDDECGVQGAAAGRMGTRG